MTNNQKPVLNSRAKVSRESENPKLRLKKLADKAGFSEKAICELRKWYDNSERKH